MDVTVLPLPEDENGVKVSRMETGPVVFAGDWPGIFIRGDHAGHFAMQLRQIKMHLVAHDLILWPESAVLDGLIDTLQSCEVKPTTPGDNKDGTSTGNSE